MNLRAGIAGYGLAGRVFHAPLVASVGGLEVSAIMTRSPERAARAAADHPGARVVADVSELLDEVDVLVVATPNDSHVELALAGVDRGLAVVVDKPLAPTADEARRLLASDGRITVFHNRRWDADFLTARRLIGEGALGEVVRMESRFERFRPGVDSGRWREHADAGAGGGLLLDLGPHLVDQAVQLFGPPLSIWCELGVRRPGAQVEDDVFLALEHELGVRSHLSMSLIAPIPGPRIRISGLEGGFEAAELDPQEAQLAAGVRPGDPAYGSGAQGRLGDHEIELDRGRWDAFYAGVRDWAADGADPPVDPADGLLVLEILEAAVRSAALGQVVTAGTDGRFTAPAS